MTNIATSDDLNGTT